MSIDIQEDYDQADGGYAILTLSTSIGDSDGSFRIRRLAGEPDKLGPKGWQPHDAVLQPISLREVGGKSIIYLGPELTQHLMEETEIEISVVALNSTFRVVWPYITPSVNSGGGRGQVVGATPVMPVKPEVKTGATTTEPGGGDKGKNTGAGGGGQTGTGGYPLPGGPELEKKGFNWLWLLPVAAVLATIAYFVFPLQPVTPDETDPPVERAEVADEVTTEEVVEAPMEEEVTPTEPGDTREGLMAEAAACRTGGCDGDAYFDIANRLTDIGVNDVFAVMSLAADSGSVPAMEWLAQSYDPLLFEANEGLLSPDISSAFLYYDQATQAGSQTAETAKAALCAALASPDTAEWNFEVDAMDIGAALERNCS